VLDMNTETQLLQYPSFSFDHLVLEGEVSVTHVLHGLNGPEVNNITWNMIFDLNILTLPRWLRWLANSRQPTLQVPQCKTQ